MTQHDITLLVTVIQSNQLTNLILFYFPSLCTYVHTPVITHVRTVLTCVRAPERMRCYCVRNFNLVKEKCTF